MIKKAAELGKLTVDKAVLYFQTILGIAIKVNLESHISDSFSNCLVSVLFVDDHTAFLPKGIMIMNKI